MVELTNLEALTVRGGGVGDGFSAICCAREFIACIKAPWSTESDTS